MSPLRLCLLIFALGPWAAAIAAGPPRPFTAHYTVQANGLTIGEMERSIRRDNQGRYTLETHMHTTGIMALFRDDQLLERSIWLPRNGGVRPLSYLYRQSGSRDRVERVDFDWKDAVATALYKGKQVRLPLKTDVYDKLAYQVMLRQDLAAGHTRFDYRVVDKDEIEDYRFRVVGKEALKTPLGVLDTLKVERIRHGNKRQTFFWCAPSLDYALVQIVQKNRGNTFASYLIDWKGGPRSALR
jgi:hypothetical protein